MKIILKILVLLLLLTSLGLSQVIVKPELPEAPEITFFDWQAMDEKEEQEYLQKLNPQLKKDLLQIKELDKRKYYSLLRKSSFMSLPSVYSIAGDGVSILSKDSEKSELRKKLTQLEIHSEVLGIKYQHAGTEDKPKLAQQLRDTLNEIFDLRESQRKEEIAELEKKLSDLKESIKIRNDNKQQIVEERFRALTGKSKYLKWD